MKVGTYIGNCSPYNSEFYVFGFITQIIEWVAPYFNLNYMFVGGVD